ncbi:MAG: hypothetical protein AAF409_21080 [Pseudomonadota bacterium]
MSLSTSESLHEVHRLAVQQNLTRALRTPQDWARFGEIGQETQDRLAAEREAFQQHYAKRLETARQVLLREENGRPLEHPRPTWAQPTRSDKETLDQKADRRVRTDHARRLAAIQQDELDQYKALRETIRSREALQGHARERFNQTNTISPEVAKSRGWTGPTRT